MIPVGEGASKAGLVRGLVKPNNTRQDDSSEASDLPVPKNRLAAILIEAIRIESDPDRRNSLIERYKQLYGEKSESD